jgi:hypothetical protein
MVEARQSVHNYTTAYMDCLLEQGVTGFPTIGVGTVMVSTPLGLDGNIDAESSALNDAAQMLCSGRILPPTHLPQPPYFEINPTLQDYYRMVDVRNCLVANGINVSTPPLASVWLAQAEPWNPWVKVTFQTDSEDTLRNLMNFCPQDGMSIPISFIPTQ